jgi:hypothetical protein
MQLHYETVLYCVHTYMNYEEDFEEQSDNEVHTIHHTKPEEKISEVPPSENKTFAPEDVKDPTPTQQSYKPR